MDEKKYTNVRAIPEICDRLDRSINWAGDDIAKVAIGDLRLLIDANRSSLAACYAGVQTIEQLIPEPSARGVADVVLFQLRAAIRLATGAKL